MWTNGDHLIADLWALMLRVNSDKDSTPDHPVREQMEAQARAAAKTERLAQLKADFARRKNRYREASA